MPTWITDAVTVQVLLEDGHDDIEQEVVRILRDEIEHAIKSLREQGLLPDGIRQIVV